MYRITITSKRPGQPEILKAVEFNRDPEQGRENARARYGDQMKITVEPAIRDDNDA